jgi:hypothetical protein
VVSATATKSKYGGGSRRSLAANRRGGGGSAEVRRGREARENRQTRGYEWLTSRCSRTTRCDVGSQVASFLPSGRGIDSTLERH